MLRHRAVAVMMTPGQHVREDRFLDSCIDCGRHNRQLYPDIKWERHNYRDIKTLRSAFPKKALSL